MPASPATIDRSLSYESVRLRWCATALWALLKRWSVALAAGLVVLGTGASSGLSGMAGLLGLTVAPLWHAAMQTPPLAVLVTAAHSLIAAALLLAVRPLLWTRHWAEAEAALPLTRAELRRSDLTVLVLAQSPLALAYAGGCASWLASPAGRSVPMAWPLALLVASMTMSTIIGMFIMRRMRSARRSKAQVGVPSVERHGAANRRAGWPWMLVLMPLRRGPAKRSARWSTLSLVGQASIVAALARWPAYGGWWLAGFAVAGMAFTARSRVVVEEDFAALHQACTPLPVRAASLRNARHALASLPAVLAVVVLTVFAKSTSELFRPAVITSFLTAALGFNLIQVTLSDLPAMEPATRVSAWLLMAVTLVALASECLR